MPLSWPRKINREALYVLKFLTYIQNFQAQSQIGFVAGQNKVQLQSPPPTDFEHHVDLI